MVLCKQPKWRGSSIYIRALRFVLNDFEASYKDLIERAKMTSRKRAILIEVFKSVYKLSPSFMRDLFEPRNIKYSLRKNNALNLYHYRTIAYQIMVRNYGMCY